MNDGRQDYVLGEDVTAMAAGSQKKGTVVLSVRLAAAELTRLEGMAQLANKTVAQIAREALGSYVISRLPEHNITIGSGEMVFKVGNPEHLTEGPNVVFAQTA